MHNIERSAFRRGEYVGYACGVWRVHKSTSGYYASKMVPGSPHVDHTVAPIERRTLRELSAALDEYAKSY